MSGKKYLGLAFILGAVLALSGCGESFPEMTEDEYNQTVEYAVGLLMRYSNNGQEKLIYVDAKEVEKQRKKEAEKLEKEQEEKAAQSQTQSTKPAKEESKTQETTTMPQKDQQESQTSEETSSEPVEAASTDDTLETPSEETQTQDPSDVVLSSDDTQEIIDDIFLSYQGYSISSSYPESSKSYVINAEKGKKLLVLRFDLFNASDSEKKVNVLEKNILYQIILNGKNLGYTSVTVLPNDLSSYVGTIDSKAHESLVILTEISEEASKEIKSLGLIVAFDGMEQTVTLK
jgi:hypothetical protein